MNDSRLEDLMRTLSAELDERLEAATGQAPALCLDRRRWFGAVPIGDKRHRVGRQGAAEMLRALADDLERRH
jgi:hypothetical protein